MNIVQKESERELSSVSFEHNVRTITTTFSLSYFVSARIFPSVYESFVPRKGADLKKLFNTFSLFDDWNLFKPLWATIR